MIELYVRGTDRDGINGEQGTVPPVGSYSLSAQMKVTVCV